MSLPLSRRLRVGALALVQSAVDARPELARAVRDAIPEAIWRRLRRFGAPVRIPRARPSARVPLDALDPFSRGPQIEGPVRTSIVVPVRDGLDHTKLCLAAVRAYVAAPQYEVVVVDDGSTDATADWVRSLAARWPVLRLVAGSGRGFAAAANAGVRATTGDVLVFLNNDAVPTPGAIARLVARIDADPSLGLVGAVSNDTGDLATIPAAYDSLAGLLSFAAERAAAFEGVLTAVPKVSLFCAAISRQTFDAAGGLDEGYAPGMFEDDDLSLFVRTRGLKVAVAQDAFVHHVGGATFRRLAASEYLETFERSRARFERKWGVRWRPPV